jgi:hypothetical protein
MFVESTSYGKIETGRKSVISTLSTLTDSNFCIGEIKMANSKSTVKRIKNPFGSGWIVDHAGKKFGRLTMLSYADGQKWICDCECGNTVAVNTYRIIHGETKSCGCLWIETIKKSNSTHGKSRTAEHSVWKGMRRRCLDSKDKAFKNYGGRGIQVCERWSKFENFLADMGNRPGKGFSLERIDNNGNYEPSNCRWATALEQSRNKRNNIFVIYGGRKHALSAICAELEINIKYVYGRISRGQDPSDALNSAIKLKGRNHET